MPQARVPVLERGVEVDQDDAARIVTFQCFHGSSSQNENRTIRSNRNRAAFLFFRTQPKSYTIPHVEVYESWRRTPLLHGSDIILLCAMH